MDCQFYSCCQKFQSESSKWAEERPVGAWGTQHTFGCRTTSALSLRTTNPFPNPGTSYPSADKVLPAPKPWEKHAIEKSESSQEKVFKCIQFHILLQNLVFWIWIIFAQRHFFFFLTTPHSLWEFCYQGSNLGPSMKVPSPNHWIVREFPRGAIFLMLRISSSEITDGFIALNLESWFCYLLIIWPWVFFNFLPFFPISKIG